MRVGLDIGSTTIKLVVLNDHQEVIYEDYRRHYSHIKDNVLLALKDLLNKNIIKDEMLIAISGSAGMGLANGSNITFIQEVYATKIACNTFIPDIDVVIELGGEDAKILFLSGGLEVRMNGSCAGGTGSFIDQMATLLNVEPIELNKSALSSTKLYQIASRCGVFAKTDIQPLLNQGANISDVAASIFKAVVNQTIGGLAQGREVTGKVCYLGGPLTFLSELQTSFNESLNIEGICPKHSLYYVAIGAALCSREKYDLKELINNIETFVPDASFNYNKPLFKDELELKQFRERHQKNNVLELDLNNYDGKLYLGVDAGSTTLKMLLIDENKNIRYSTYLTNKGNPVNVLKDELIKLYETYPNINIVSSASTGYGEDLMKNAFCLDCSLVETMAHFKAAKKFMPNVDFIIDIGGQDIKCFKIENQTITNIFLNEACSSGCGSFLQTFANSLGYEIEEFAKIGLLAKKPVDLGSRCTVFMNSSVKQAQKDGATIDNISAGLSISVVKNALYKVIRATNVKELGRNIVVQGGTFYNEAVLRAFEQELNLEVISPNISGLMGAYGAALYAMDLKNETSSIINIEGLKNFVHNIKTTNCKGCSNNCLISINTFSNSTNRFISGNRCEKPLGNKLEKDSFNLYQLIRDKLMSYPPKKGKRGPLGIPLVLNNYELFPFWYTFFTKLNFEVHHSGFSNQKIYTLGQNSIPSDTICYPAKLVHGHIRKLLIDDFKNIFYPCMSYNIDELKSDNHYNCPVVAYYPEVIKNNIELDDVNFIYDYVLIHDKERFNIIMHKILKNYFSDITKKEVLNASKHAYKAYDDYLSFIKLEAQRIIKEARENNMQIVVLAGRPYHVDPEVNHGIDKLITTFNVAVITEESISHLVEKQTTSILNQWTYHARLYDAAKYICDYDDINLIQLVSFGCGLDAITTDETKTILERNNKIYTQIKIDEIDNLGAVKIRLRSLFETLKNK